MLKEILLIVALPIAFGVTINYLVIATNMDTVLGAFLRGELLVMVIMGLVYNYQNVDIIAVEIKPGDTVAVDDTLITLETDKATMDVPAEAAGVVKDVPSVRKLARERD